MTQFKRVSLKEWKEEVINEINKYGFDLEFNMHLMIDEEDNHVWGIGFNERILELGFENEEDCERRIEFIKRELNYQNVQEEWI